MHRQDSFSVCDSFPGTAAAASCLQEEELIVGQTGRRMTHTSPIYLLLSFPPDAKYTLKFPHFITGSVLTMPVKVLG